MIATLREETKEGGSLFRGGGIQRKRGVYAVLRYWGAGHGTLEILWLGEREVQRLGEKNCFYILLEGGNLSEIFQKREKGGLLVQGGVSRNLVSKGEEAVGADKSGISERRNKTTDS